MKIAITTDTHWGFSNYAFEQNLQMLQDIKNNKVDLILHCGDFGSSMYPERIDYWRTVRDMFPKIPIGTVFGNHDYWNGKFPTILLTVEELEKYKKPHSPADVIQQNFAIFEKYNISYIPDGLEFPDHKVYITGADCWYHEEIYTNDINYIPHYNYPEGKQWLLKRMYTQFNKSIQKVKEYKEKNYITIFVSHFGIIQKAAEQDYKSTYTSGFRRQERQYFGADPALEDLLENVDYYLFGHSHTFYEGVAKNNFTKILNVGSDYEKPKYKILEI